MGDDTARQEAEAWVEKRLVLSPRVDMLAAYLAGRAAGRAEGMDLGHALFDALTDGVDAWVRGDGGENKLAVAVANYRRALDAQEGTND